MLRKSLLGMLVAVLFVPVLAVGTPQSASPRFSVTLPRERAAAPLDGRLLLILAPSDKSEPRFQIAHEVWVTKDSRLWTIMADKLDGESLQVNSRHHQAVKRVAPGFEVSATAPDGVIEAIERPASRFCLAVQWHPENFWRTGEFRPLFEHFLKAARDADASGGEK